MCACRDVRALTGGLADATGQAVRERFARLHQIAMLLTQESTQEIAELWSDASVSWRLSPAEVRTVLSNRIDLDQAAVAALQLS
jgi:conserved oligomeric Golgi complex subunit 4